jgi:hypothetical protein
MDAFHADASGNPILDPTNANSSSGIFTGSASKKNKDFDNGKGSIYAIT